jgi:hypothetical protein
MINVRFTAVILLGLLSSCNRSKESWTVVLSPPRPWIAQDLKSEYESKLGNQGSYDIKNITFSDSRGIAIQIDGCEREIADFVSFLRRTKLFSGGLKFGITYSRGKCKIHTPASKDFAFIFALKPLAAELGLSKREIQSKLIQYNAGTRLMSREDLGNLVVYGHHLKDLVTLEFKGRPTAVSIQPNVVQGQQLSF